MTPPAAAAPTRPRAPRATARRTVTRRPVARRAASRPATGRTTNARPARPVAGRAPVAATVQARPLGLRLAHTLAALPDSRLVDRMVRGRIWIAVLAAGLVGIVFLQISLLKLNTGISRAVESTQTLERQNASLKTQLSELGSSERVKESAAVMGFVSPATGQPQFVNAKRASAARAAANLTAPAPIQQLPLGMIPPSEGGVGSVIPDAVSTAPGVAPASATPVAEPAEAVAAAPTPAVAVPSPEAAVTAPAPAAAPAPAVTSPAPPAEASGGLAATGRG